MEKHEFYKMQCDRRLKDLVYWVSRVYDGQTVDADFVFKNSTLGNICKGSRTTQKLIDWCKEQLQAVSNK